MHKLSLILIYTHTHTHTKPDFYVYIQAHTKPWFIHPITQTKPSFTNAHKYKRASLCSPHANKLPNDNYTITPYHAHLLPHPSHTSTSNKIECKDTAAKYTPSSCHGFVSSYVLRFFLIVPILW